VLPIVLLAALQQELQFRAVADCNGLVTKLPSVSNIRACGGSPTPPRNQTTFVGLR
jgi:hypothetical protein